MQGRPPQSKPPPRPARRVSPAEWAWLDRINRQLAYDEYMQAKREFWLAARPARGGIRPGLNLPRPFSRAAGAEGGIVLTSNELWGHNSA